MESQQNAMNQAPAPAPQQPSSGKLWVGLSVLLTLVSIGLLVALVLTLTSSTPAADQTETETTQEQTSDNTADQQEETETTEDEASEEETEMAWETYSNRGINLEFPTSWNVFGQFFYDNPNATVPEFNVFLNQSPIQTVSPSGGPALATDVEIRSFEPGSAYLAGYEEANWASYESDTITIGGQTVERLRLTAGEDMVYVPQNMEVLFFIGESISYEVIYSYADGAMSTDWTRIKNSLRFTDNVNVQ